MQDTTKTSMMLMPSVLMILVTTKDERDSINTSHNTAFYYKRVATSELYCNALSMNESVS